MFIIEMARKGRTRTKQSTRLINTEIEELKDAIITTLDIKDSAGYDEFYNEFLNYIDYDISMIKDCPEKSIVEFYIDSLASILNKNKKYINNKLFLDELRKLTRNELAKKFAPDIPFDDTIDKYFNDVKREYIKHPMGESELYEMTDENRDLFIKNNLKTVIECAKRYRGLGVDFEDLIQIGNMGLLKAWYKFDTSKSDLQNNIIQEITDFYDDVFTYDDAVNIITNNFKYPKLLEQTIAKLPEEGFDSKRTFIDWAKDNIKKASFASLGFIWARAAITSELNGLSILMIRLHL